MSIKQVLMIIWRRGYVVVLALFAATVAAGGVLLFIPGRYDAVATASIDPGSIDPVTQSGANSSTSIGLMQGNMLQLVTSERVALDVVKRLNLTASPAVQAQFQASDSFGRESIDNWMALNILRNVVPQFAMGTDVLSIKYKSGDPNQAALVANAFLAATIDNAIAMKAASGDRAARWFAPQIDELHKEVEAARNALASFQAKMNVVAPTATAGDTESSALASVTQNLNSVKASLAFQKNRLTTGVTDLSIDPSDPDLQILSGLKEKLSSAETTLAAVKNSLGANNPKMVAEAANIAATRRQIAEETERMHQHLKERIAQNESLIPQLEEQQANAEKELIAAQAQRGRLAELQRDLGFRLEQLNARQKAAEQATLQSKLTFADISVLDKAAPPISPAFPKPFVVMPVGIVAGLALGLLLALIAEAMDRRIRVPADLEFTCSAPLLGVIRAGHRVKSGGGSRRLRAA